MTRTILLADDSVTIQKVVELTFMDQDYEIVAVSDGKAAVAKLSELRPDLLIADVHMPGADGYEVCRSAKEIHPGLPVLLLVGTFEPFDEHQAATSRADAHLKKPFDSQDLLAQVEVLAGRPQGTSPAAEPQAAKGAGQAVEVSDLEPPSLTAEAPAAELTAAAAAEAGTEPLPTAPEAPVPAAPAPAAAGSRTTPIELPLEPTAAPAAAGEETPAAAAGSRTTPIELPLKPTAAPAAAAEETPPSPSETPEPAVATPPAPSASTGDGALSDEDVDRVARRVAELVGEKLLREVAWEVVPDLAELIIKERIQELESQVE